MGTEGTMQVTITENQQRYMSWTSDVLVYIVVLNLFVEFVDAIVIDSFWISILTAVLLKALLDVVIRLEHRVGAIRVAEGELAGFDQPSVASALDRFAVTGEPRRHSHFGARCRVEEW